MGGWLVVVQVLRVGSVGESSLRTLAYTCPVFASRNPNPAWYRSKGLPSHPPSACSAVVMLEWDVHHFLYQRTLHQSNLLQGRTVLAWYRISITLGCVELHNKHVVPNVPWGACWLWSLIGGGYRLPFIAPIIQSCFWLSHLGCIVLQCGDGIKQGAFSYTHMYPWGSQG